MHTKESTPTSHCDGGIRGMTGGNAGSSGQLLGATILPLWQQAFPFLSMDGLHEIS